MIRVCLIALVVLLPSAATAFRAENRVDVIPGPAGFTILDGGGFGARGMWCAAADYALKALRAPATARLYITGPRTTSRGPVVFSLDPGSVVPVPVFLVGASLRRPGATLSVAHALTFCADAKVIDP